MHHAARKGWLGLLSAAIVAGCGFGLYDGSASPSVLSANDGVADAGQWWPWACALPDGTFSNPSPPSTPQPYVATGSCGPGGPFTLSVDGCEMFADWSVLGLSNVQTTQPTSTPNLGGWILTATEGAPGDGDGGPGEGGGDGGADDGGLDGGETLTCTATFASAGILTFSCSAGTPPVTTCQSTLAQVVQ
jgi:hypothetical protein